MPDAIGQGAFFMKRATYFCFVSVAVFAVVLISGCPSPPSSGSAGAKAALKPFTSASELVGYFRDQAVAHRSTRGIFGFDLAMGAAPVAAGAPEAAAANTDSAATSHTTTNLQEEGVDESDVFKSDGTNFYLAKGKTLRIVRAAPADQMEELANVQFDDYIDSLYLLDGKALVLTRGGGVYGERPILMGPMPANAGVEVMPMIWPPYFEQAKVTVSEVDVSDPAAASVTKHVEFDGSLVTSRLTNGHLILVLTIAPTLPQPVNVLTMATVTLSQAMPKMRPSDGPESFMVPPENWYHPETPDGYYTTAVMTLDAADVESVLGSVAVLASAGTIYASTEALYLTDTEYTADNQYRETTAVHKLAFNSDGVATYTASGSVSGRLLNQFSLDEQDGYLRLATHITNFGVGVAAPVGVAEPDGTVSSDTAQNINDPHNAVYVLQEQDGSLEVVGSLEDIAPNENLYAARFMADRGFLVTFQQIDPLSVLDLSDPTAPKLVGELEVPGYSDYLHPFGDNLLIGVGRSTMQISGGFTEPGGVQLSLFDVSDLKHPTLVDQVTVGGFGSQSDVSFNHKAFAFLPERGLLVIPAVLMSEQVNPWDWGWSYQPELDGVLVYHVESSGFTELGRVSSVVYDELGWTQWRRGAIIDDAVYAVTPAGLRAATLDDFDHSVELVLTPNDDEVGQTSGGGGQTEPGSPGEPVASTGM
jgi:uncharacterized secreted protein with C-terminal beta-propeller domain